MNRLAHRHLRSWVGHLSVMKPRDNTGNFHRKGYLMLHRLAGATCTIQVANFVILMRVTRNEGELIFATKLVSAVLIDFSLTVKAATLIFISGRGPDISSAKQGKSGSIYNLLK